MKQKTTFLQLKYLKYFILISLVAVALMLLSGCSGTSQEEDQQAQNRQYMSSVNQIMDTLDSSMDDFATAVKDGEILSLSSQLSAVDDCVNSLNDLDVPDDMEDIQASYLDGAQKLQTALQLYVQLYQDVSIPENGSFDYTTYDSRISEIQQYYNDGLASIESADEQASQA